MLFYVLFFDALVPPSCCGKLCAPVVLPFTVVSLLMLSRRNTIRRCSSIRKINITTSVDNLESSLLKFQFLLKASFILVFDFLMEINLIFIEEILT